MFPHPRVGHHQRRKFVLGTRDAQGRPGKNRRSEGTLLGDDLDLDTLGHFGPARGGQGGSYVRQSGHITPEPLRIGRGVAARDAHGDIVTREEAPIVGLDIVQGDRFDAVGGALFHVLIVGPAKEQVFQDPLAVDLIRRRADDLIDVVLLVDLDPLEVVGVEGRLEDHVTQDRIEGLGECLGHLEGEHRHLLVHLRAVGGGPGIEQVLDLAVGSSPGTSLCHQ